MSHSSTPVFSILGKTPHKTLRTFGSLGALLAIVFSVMAQLPLAAAPAAQPDRTSGIIAAQLRRQGITCTEPRDAKRDRNDSTAHIAVWTLHCDEATYRVKLIPRMRARTFLSRE
jgi:hypothetical protein